MVLSKIISKVLHRCHIIGHHHIDIDAVFGKLVIDAADQKQPTPLATATVSVVNMPSARTTLRVIQK